MQSIERYGLVALLFLVVTIIAVLIWDEDATASGHAVAAAPTSANPGADTAKTPPRGPKAARRAKEDQKDPDSQRVALQVAPKGHGLTRSELEQRKHAEQERLAALNAELAAARGSEQRAGLVSAGTPSMTSRIDHSNDPAGARDAAVRGSTDSGDRGRASRSAALQRSASADSTGATKGQVAQAKPRAGGEYRVRPGDTLGEIAQRELGTFRRWKEIVELNPGMNPDRIVEGQTLVLPAGAAVSSTPSVARSTPSASSQKSTPPASSAASGDYRVAEGDSLWKIAARSLGNGERWVEIAALNPKVDPNRLNVGQSLKLPGESSSKTLAAPKPGQLVAANVGGGSSGKSASGRRVR